MKKAIFGFICLTLLMVMPGMAASAAESGYISDVVIEQGGQAEGDLLKNDYTIVYPTLTADRYVGYRTTFSQSGAMTGIAYEDGKLVAKSGAGHGPVVGLYFLNTKGNMPLPNNGGLPVLDESGKAAEFDTGESVSYLIYVPEGNFKPYIADVRLAKADSKKAAVEDLIGQGCEYFVDKNYGSGDETVILGYSRTDKEDEAVTDIIGLGEEDAAPAGYEPVSEDEASGHILYITKDTDMGNPLRDIEAFEEVEDTEIPSSVVTDMRLSRTDAMSKQYIVSENGFSDEKEKEKTYIMVGVDTSDKKDTGIALIMDGDGYAEKREAKRELVAVGATDAVSGEAASVDESDVPVVTEDEAEPSAEPTDTGNVVVNDFETPSEQAEGETAADTGSADAGSTDAEASTGAEPAGGQAEGEEAEALQGTVLNVLGGTGATIFFGVLMAIAVLIPIGTLIIKSRIESGMQAKDDETSDEK